MNKKQLRQELKGKREQIAELVKKEKSHKIKKKLEKLEIFQEAYTVLFYVSLPDEVDTHQLIKEAFETKKVVVPMVNKKELLLKQISGFDQLKPGALNILEPDTSTPSVDLSNINVVIVPGVAFDKKHYRLGYGGGFYDHLLSTEDNFISIGLAFEEQILEELPVEPHDQKVDFVVTDKKII